MALYFYFNETTGDLVYSDKATYGGSGYTSLGQQTNIKPTSKKAWIFHSQRARIRTVTKDPATSSQIDVLTSTGYMFEDCSLLTSLDLSGFDTSNVTNMRSMFEGCTNLTSLDLSGFNTSNVTIMNSTFERCTSLTSLNLSGLDTSSVKYMNYTFSACTSLTSLDLSGFNTSSVTTMNNTFIGCTSLTSLDLSSLDTSAVTDMAYMFGGCTSLTSLDLSGFDTSSVRVISGMFEGCTSLTSLDLSDFDTSSVTNTISMFDSCTNLRLITISDKMSNVISLLPADQYYPASGGSPVAKADLTAGTWVRDEADLTKVTSIVQQAQMQQAINRRIGILRRRINQLESVLKTSHSGGGAMTG